MYVVHPDDVRSEPSEGGHFRTLLSPDLGGALGVYLLSITRSEPHVHDAEDQIYIVQKGRAVAEIDDERGKSAPATSCTSREAAGTASRRSAARRWWCTR